MTRTLTAAVLSQLTTKEVQVGILVELNTDAGSVRAWSGIGDLISGGNTFQGVGHLGGISPVQESGAEIRANALSLQLSGVPSSLISTALTTQYQGRPARVWIAFFSDLAFSTPSLIADPILVFSGRADVMVIDEGPETATITVTIESRLADLLRPRVRRYTDQEQKAMFPGDRGLEFVASLQDRELQWGGGAASGTSLPPVTIDEGGAGGWRA